MKRFLLVLSLILIGAITASALDPIRISVVTTPSTTSTATIVVYNQTGGGSAIATITTGSLSTDASGVLSFVLDDASWSAITYDNTTKNYIVHVTYNGKLVGNMRLEDLVRAQGLFGAVINPNEMQQDGAYTFGSLTVGSGSTLITLPGASGGLEAFKFVLKDPTTPTNIITFKAGHPVVSYDITYPLVQGIDNQVMQTNGTAGQLEWVTNNLQNAYDNGNTITGTNPVIIGTTGGLEQAASSPAWAITNTGAATFNDNVTLGDAVTDVATVNGEIGDGTNWYISRSGGGAGKAVFQDLHIMDAAKTSILEGTLAQAAATPTWSITPAGKVNVQDFSMTKVSGVADFAGTLQQTGATPTWSITNAGAASFASTLGVTGTSTMHDVVPFATATYDLGKSGNVWANVYATTFHGAMGADLTFGNGIATYNDKYNGSTAKTISVQLNGTTLLNDGSGAGISLNLGKDNTWTNTQTFNTAATSLDVQGNIVNTSGTNPVTIDDNLTVTGTKILLTSKAPCEITYTGSNENTDLWISSIYGDVVIEGVGFEDKFLKVGANSPTPDHCAPGFYDAYIQRNLEVDAQAWFDGSTTIGDAVTDDVTINAALAGANPLVFEGATSDDITTTFAITNPTTTSKTITFPDATGTVLLDNTVNGFAWTILGNSGTTAGTNFIGTTDNQDLVFKRGGIESGRINLAGLNTSFGYQAMLNNVSTGGENTAFGYNALTENTTGGYNTAMGAVALEVNQTGANNVAIGHQALRYNTVSYNTGVGTMALGSNTTGTYNTALGHNAGNNAMTTTDFSVFIGAGTTAKTDNDQNEIVIGYNATGNGSNSVTIGNGSITETHLQGAVTAGTYNGFTLPTGAAGTDGQIWTSNGATQTMQWSTIADAMKDLTAGTGIVTFTYDGSVAKTVAIDQTASLTWTGTETFNGDVALGTVGDHNISVYSQNWGVTSGGVATFVDLNLTGTSGISTDKLVLKDDDTGLNLPAETTTIQAYTDITTSYVLTLPPAQAGDNQVLQTNGTSGDFEWVTNNLQNAYDNGNTISGTNPVDITGAGLDVHSASTYHDAITANLMNNNTLGTPQATIIGTLDGTEMEGTTYYGILGGHNAIGTAGVIGSISTTGPAGLLGATVGGQPYAGFFVGNVNIANAGDFNMYDATEETPLNVFSVDGATGNIYTKGIMQFEGATDDTYETQLQVANPTDDRFITFPDLTGTVVLQSSTTPLTTDYVPKWDGTKLVDSKIIAQDGQVIINNVPFGVMDGAGTNFSVATNGYISNPAGTTVTVNDNLSALGTITGSSSLTLGSDATPTAGTIVLNDGVASNSFTGTIQTFGTLTGSQTWTFPNATGTVALLENKLSNFAATTSSELAGVISDETGSGALVFGTAPTINNINLTGTFTVPINTIAPNSLDHGLDGQILATTGAVGSEVVSWQNVSALMKDMTQGTGVSFSVGTTYNGSTATTINVNYDDATIGINGSDQLYVKADGIGPTQIDETKNYSWSNTQTFNGTVNLGTGMTDVVNVVTNSWSVNGTTGTPIFMGNITGKQSLILGNDATGTAGTIVLNDATISNTNYGTIQTASNLTSSQTWTFPNATGTVALLENKLSDFAATTSAELAGVITGETGTGALVFGTAPTINNINLTGTVVIPDHALQLNDLPAGTAGQILTTDGTNVTWGGIAGLMSDLSAGTGMSYSVGGPYDGSAVATLGIDQTASLTWTGVEKFNGGVTFGDGTNANTVTINPNTTFIPGTTNVNDLGSATNVWANAYATTLHGALDGNATTATTAAKVAHALTIGNGLATNADTYDGSADKTISVQLNGTTLLNNGTGTGISLNLGNANTWTATQTFTTAATSLDVQGDIVNTSLSNPVKVGDAFEVANGVVLASDNTSDISLDGARTFVNSHEMHIGGTSPVGGDLLQVNSHANFIDAVTIGDAGTDALTVNSTTTMNADVTMNARTMLSTGLETVMIGTHPVITPINDEDQITIPSNVTVSVVTSDNDNAAYQDYIILPPALPGQMLVIKYVKNPLELGSENAVVVTAIGDPTVATLTDGHSVTLVYAGGAWIVIATN